MTLLEFLPFRRYRNRVAFIEQSAYRVRKYTYGQVEDGARRIAAALKAQSIGEGDRVILWGENSARWAMTFYACLMRRVVSVPVDVSFSPELVERIRLLTRARLVCSDREGAEWNRLLEFEPAEDEAKAPEDALLEIIYTSGTTGDPKGVMITHGNVLSNLLPIQSEYRKYEKYAWPFSPIGFAQLIPLSHLFGQIMGLFIPQMLGGYVVFTEPAAANVIQAIKRNKVNAAVCVPQELSVLRRHVARDVTPGPDRLSVAKRWWRYRKLHLRFGWQFWAFIVGGATLPAEDEAYWGDLGFAVIQGYGLTETAPAVTISHPFKGIRRGAVGQKLPGMEVKIAEDGEILVRGPNVTPGYYQNEQATSEVLKDGWLHTGDLGELDEEGNLRLLGRKKEVIVTREGLNVYPHDVERVLLQDPRVRDCAVVSREDQVHAVFVSVEGASETELADAVRQANGKLEGFQRIQSWSLWPEPELPRTFTGKLKRLAIAKGSIGAGTPERETGSIVERILSGSAAGDEELALSSLDRMELLVELEQASGAVIDDAEFARAKTVGDLAHLVERPAMEPGAHYPYWNWPLWFPVRAFRYLMLYGLVFPLMKIRFRLGASGLENLQGVRPPVLFVSNHQSIIDAPVILRALPYPWRHSVAPAMGTGRKWWEIYLSGIFFNVYPLPGTSVGLREALQQTGKLVDRGYSPLVFPEGVRTADGSLQPFRGGIGVIAAQTKLRVVPILLRGAYEAWPVFARGPRKGTTLSVSFGAPIDFSGKDPATITKELEAWYRDHL